MAKTPNPPDDAVSPEDGGQPDDATEGSRGGKISRALSGSERSLDRRWWWSGAVQGIVGFAVIGFQWEVITSGQAIWATWMMVVIGAALLVSGGVTAWRDRPNRPVD